MTVQLPSYVTAVPENSPAFSALNSTLHVHLLRPPGHGGFASAQIITFTQPHYVYRIYGGEEGNASQCGYWWNLDPPANSTTSYFEEFAVCTEWNDATHLVWCRVPVGYDAVVGMGQSADCANGDTIVPEEDVWQLNGNICEIASLPHAADVEGRGLTCEWCAADDASLQDSDCVADLSVSHDVTIPSWTSLFIVGQRVLVAGLFAVVAIGVFVFDSRNVGRVRLR